VILFVLQSGVNKQHVPIISAYCTPQSDGHKEGETKTHACVCHDIYSGGGGDKKEQ
jgi:hypothetical protein